MKKSIQYRLTLAFIGFAVFPLLLVGVLLAWQSFTNMRQEAVHLQQEVARSISVEASSFINSLENDLRMVVDINDIHMLTRRRQLDLLGALQAHQKAFVELTLLDGDGRERVRLSRLKTITSDDLCDRSKKDEFLIPEKEAKTYYSPVWFDATTGEPFITIALPLKNLQKGQVDGVLVADVFLKKIWNLIAGLRTNPGEDIYIVDAQGRVIAHNNPSVVLRDTHFTLPEKAGFYSGLSSSSVVMAIDRIRFGDQIFAIVAEREANQALSLAIRTVWIVVSLVLVVFVVACGVGILTMRRIVHPIQKLAKVARDIQAGELSKKAPVSSDDEIGELATAFNNMTHQLSQTMESLQTEVAERKRAESVLQESEKKLSQIVDGTSIPTFVIDKQHTVTHWNRACENLTGVSASEIVGTRKQWSAFYPEERPVMADLVMNESAEEEMAKYYGGKYQKSAITEGAYEAENFFPDLGENGKWLFFTAAPLKDHYGKVVGAIETVQDITRRKLAEQAMRESEERFRTIFDSISDAVFIHDIETGEILNVNNTACNIYGYTREELRRLDVQTISMGKVPYTQQDAIERIKKAAAGEPQVFEWIGKHKSGRLFWTEVSMKSAVIGGRERLLVVVRDITDRKRAEKKLRRTVTDLERSNAELQQFAYVASHDLQEPLRMVSSYVQLLARRYKDKLDSDADDFIAFAVDGALRMQTLINDLLTYSRVGTRGKPFEPSDCEAVLEQVLANLKLAIEESRAVITHDALPTVMADSSQLVQLIQNLTDNAIKFRGKETPRIHISATKGPGIGGQRSEVGYQRSEIRDRESKSTNHELQTTNYEPRTTNYQAWIFSVRDNGIGIDPEFFDRIFTIFQRLHNREEYPGTGIGLAVCKKIVERHGGRIWVESQPGKGTSFFFTIPDRDS